MELTGKIIKVLDVFSGEGKNGQWKKQDFILELPGQYQRKVCITLFGDKIEQFKVNSGDEVRVEIDIESREYNDRWYTNIKAWKVEKTQASGTDPLPDYDISQESPESQGLEPNEDLPF